MTDKEKIELIIESKHLNNTQFCNEVCIAPGTLSHIRNGRTEPTLNILRNISQAFPDINPAWLFFGEGEMYKDGDSPTPESENTNDDSLNTNVGSDSFSEDGQLPLFFPDDTFPTSQTATVKPQTSSSAASTSSSGSGRRSSSAQASSAAAAAALASLASPQVVQEVVAETLRQQQKSTRKVTEVRIFFDDGTFETFGAK